MAGEHLYVMNKHCQNTSLFLKKNLCSSLLEQDMFKDRQTRYTQIITPLLFSEVSIAKSLPVVSQIWEHIVQ